MNFAVGNLLSIYSPKKLDYSKFGRQRASQMTVLVSLALQFVVVGVGVSAFWIARYLRKLLDRDADLAGVWQEYRYRSTGSVLNRMDRLAQERREMLVAELCRA